MFCEEDYSAKVYLVLLTLMPEQVAATDWVTAACIQETFEA